MSTRRIKLTFPETLIKEPVLYTVAKHYEVIPNIRRARVSDTVGEIVLELSGEETNLEDAILHMEGLGIEVEPVSGDIVAG